MWESNVVLKDAMLASAQADFLNAFDRIDAGDKNVPRAVGLAYQQAGPQERQRLRDMVQGRLAERHGFIDASLDTMRQYQADMQRTKGRVTDLTDVEGVADFTHWLAFNGGQGLATMAPLMVTAVLSGPAAPVTVGALGLGMATGEVNNDRIEFARKQGMDAQGVGEYVAKKAGSTMATAIPFAALDVAAGPVGSLVKHGVKAGAKEVSKDAGQEALTGGAQEAMKLATGYLLGETDELLTRENARKVFNAAGAEAAGGLTGGTVRVAGTALAQGTVPRVQDQPATPEAPPVPPRREPTIDVRYETADGKTVTEVVRGTGHTTAAAQAPAPGSLNGAVGYTDEPLPEGATWSEVAAADRKAQAEVEILRQGASLPEPDGHAGQAAPAAEPIAQRASAAGTRQPSVDAALQGLEEELPLEPAAEGAAAQGPTAGPALAMHWTRDGTLGVTGDPDELSARLSDAGVNMVIRGPAGVMVAPEQAAQAQQVLAGQRPAAANAAAQQPPPVQLSMREGGMLNVGGDPGAVRQWLEDAGIPRSAIRDGPRGVIVTAGSVERARQALVGPGTSAALLDRAPAAQDIPLHYSQAQNIGIDLGPITGAEPSREDFRSAKNSSTGLFVSKEGGESKKSGDSSKALGKISIEEGAAPDSNELLAGRGLADYGYTVRHQMTANDKGIPGERTADLYVEGVGEVDVYTPRKMTESTILRGIESKKGQVTSVFIQMDPARVDMNSLLARLWGKPNLNSIENVFIQRPDGVVDFIPRPKKEN